MKGANNGRGHKNSSNRVYQCGGSAIRGYVGESGGMALQRSWAIGDNLSAPKRNYSLMLSGAFFLTPRVGAATIQLQLDALLAAHRHSSVAQWQSIRLLTGGL